MQFHLIFPGVEMRNLLVAWNSDIFVVRELTEGRSTIGALFAKTRSDLLLLHWIRSDPIETLVYDERVALLEKTRC